MKYNVSCGVNVRESFSVWVWADDEAAAREQAAAEFKAHGLALFTANDDQPAYVAADAGFVAGRVEEVPE